MDQLAVPGVILMENAGRQCADIAARMLQSTGGCRATIIAGSGNNGGDGFVVARQLLTRGYLARVILLTDPQRIKGDALVNLRPLEKLGIDVTETHEATQNELRQIILDAAAESDLLVDAIFGTGLADEVREPFATAIAAINDATRPVLAVDLPSGLDADSGLPLGAAVRATATVSMAAPKIGFENPQASQYLGEIYIADIGVPVAEE